ncbi:Mitogen-activated protein kinase kinase kinase A [Diplonema papillatum]|nr:Mitogen-activated protein kinase kinase kinase A [Diplonema papillatum]
MMPIDAPLERIEVLLKKALTIVKNAAPVESAARAQSPVAATHRLAARMFVRLAISEIDEAYESETPEFMKNWKWVRACLLQMTAGRVLHSTCPAGVLCLLRDSGKASLKFYEAKHILFDTWTTGKPRPVSGFAKKPRIVQQYLKWLANRTDAFEQLNKSVLESEIPTRSSVLLPQTTASSIGCSAASNASSTMNDSTEAPVPAQSEHTHHALNQLKRRHALSAWITSLPLCTVTWLAAGFVDAAQQEAWEHCFPPFALAFAVSFTLFISDWSKRQFVAAGITSLAPAAGWSALGVVPMWLTLLVGLDDRKRIGASVLWVIAAVARMVLCSDFSKEMAGILYVGVLAGICLHVTLVVWENGILDLSHDSTKASTADAMLRSFDFNASADLLSLRPRLAHIAKHFASILESMQSIRYSNDRPLTNNEMEELSMVQRQVDKLCTPNDAESDYSNFDVGTIASVSDHGCFESASDALGQSPQLYPDSLPTHQALSALAAASATAVGPPHPMMRHVHRGRASNGSFGSAHHDNDVSRQYNGGHHLVDPLGDLSRNASSIYTQQSLQGGRATSAVPALPTLENGNDPDIPAIDMSTLRDIFSRASQYSDTCTALALARAIRADEALRAMWLMHDHLRKGYCLADIDKAVDCVLAVLDEDPSQIVDWKAFVGMLPEIVNQRQGKQHVLSRAENVQQSFDEKNTSGHNGSLGLGSLRRRTSADMASLSPRSSRGRGRSSPVQNTMLTAKYLKRTFSGASNFSRGSDNLMSTSSNGSFSAPSPSFALQTTDKTSGLLLRDIDSRHQLTARAQGEIDKHIGIIVLNSAPSEIGNVLYWNSYMEHTSLILSENITGQQFYTLVMTEDELDILTSSVAYVLEGKPVPSFTLAFPKGDGERIQYNVDVLPSFSTSLVSKRGKRTENKAGVVLLCTQKVEDSMIKSSLVEWLTAQLRKPIGIAHATIKRNKKLLSEQKLSDSMKELDKLAVQTRRLLSIAKQLTSVSSCLARHPVALRAVLTKVISDFNEVAEARKVSMHFNIPPGFPAAVYGDPEKLPETISYLIHHAMEHTNHLVANIWVDVIAEKEVSSTVDSLLIRVSDDGPGIKEDKLNALFRPCRLWQGGIADKEIDWDLGLCNVKVVVEEMGGTLGVKSIVNSGTEFTVVLPLMPVNIEPDKSKNANQYHSEDAQLGPQRACLVHESNVILRTSICNQLWPAKWAVMSANTSEEVLSNLKNVHVVLYGVDKGDLTGLSETVDNLMKHAAEVEIIILVEKSTTAHLSPAMHRAVDNETIHLIVKPFVPSEIQEVMRKIERKIEDKESMKHEIEKIRKALTERSLPWTRGRLLGTGTHGKVYEATTQKTGGVMAVKIVTVDNDQEVKNIIKEITLMSRLQHPHIIHYFYCEKRGCDLHMFMEYAEGGSLASTIKRDRPLSACNVASFLDDILSGLDFLHENDVVHRDLKPANVLIGENHKCKIGDFGCAVNLKEATAVDFTTNGTVLYMAPEVLRGDKHGWQVDIWSLGCVAMEFITGKPPFYHLGSAMQVMNAHLSAGGVDPDIGDVHADYRGSAEAYDFAKKCLRMDPSKRPTAASLRSHALICTRFRFRCSDEATHELPDLDASNGEGVATGGKLTSGSGAEGKAIEGSPAVNSENVGMRGNASSYQNGLLVRNSTYATGRPPVPRSDECSRATNRRSMGTDDAFTVTIDPLASLFPWAEADDDDLDAPMTPPIDAAHVALDSHDDMEVNTSRSLPDSVTIGMPSL